MIYHVRIIKDGEPKVIYIEAQDDASAMQKGCDLTDEGTLNYVEILDEENRMPCTFTALLIMAGSVLIVIACLYFVFVAMKGWAL